jgi:ABC-type amino acid transport substrate-binding protein
MPDPDPRFLDRLHDELARELRLSVRRSAPVAGNATTAPTRRGPVTRPAARSTRLLLAAALVLIGTIGGALLAGAPAPSTPDDLLAQVRARGELRIRLPEPADPDWSAPGSFSTQVAVRLGERLGIPTRVVYYPGGQATSAWDLAIPAALGPVDPAQFATSQPIYHAPVWLEVQSEQLTFDELVGLRICAVEGSVGAAWLARAPAIESSTPVASVPANLQVTLVPTHGDCGRGMGGWDLRVTAGVVTSPGGLGRVAVGPNSVGWRQGYEGDPVLTLPIPLVAPRDGPDPTSLLALVDIAIADLREDGTLADLSRATFYRDLSVPPSTDGRDVVQP